MQPLTRPEAALVDVKVRVKSKKGKKKTASTHRRTEGFSQELSMSVKGVFSKKYNRNL